MRSIEANHNRIETEMAGNITTDGKFLSHVDPVLTPQARSLPRLIKLSARLATSPSNPCFFANSSITFTAP